MLFGLRVARSFLNRFEFVVDNLLNEGERLVTSSLGFVGLEAINGRAYA